MKRFTGSLLVAVIGLLFSSLSPSLSHFLKPMTTPSLTEYWTLSDAVYNLSTTLENGGTYVPPKGYTLIKVSTSAQLLFGFAAAALKDSNGNVIIANEGTLPGTDVFGKGSLAADLVIADGKIPTALTYAQTFAQQVEKKLGGNAPLFVTGHSLGGIEAQAEEYILFASSTPTNAAGGATFGATGLPGQTTSGGPANLINYVDYGDPVGNDASDTGTQNPFAPTTPMYHHGTVVMVGPTSDVAGLETASYLEKQYEDTNPMAQYGAYSGDVSDMYWLGSLSLLGEGLQYHKLPNYAADLSINMGSSPFVPLDSLDEAIYALGAPLWNGDESNLGSGTISKTGTLTTPDFKGSYNTSTDQFTIKQTAAITDVSGKIVKGGTNTLTLDPTTNSITQETYTSPDGTIYNATLNPTTEEFQTLEANEANGASYQIQYTYTDTNGLSSTVTIGYTSSNLNGTLEFTQTTNYNADGAATTASISGTGDIATLDNADITIESNPTATTSGNTSNGTDNIISLGTNDNITVAADAGETSFTDAVNAASSATNFATDMITFEGHSIAGNVPTGGIDKYGRTYTANGGTVTISKGSDALTIHGFVNGDFGVNFGYTYTTFTSTTPTLSLEGINNSGLMTADDFTGEEGYLGTPGNFSVLDPHYSYEIGDYAYGINNSGQVVGDVEFYAPHAIDEHGWLYSGGAFSKISVPGSKGTEAHAISDSGEIVGKYYPAVANFHLFKYASGTYTSFDVPGAAPDSTGSLQEDAWGVNNSGQIVGYFTDSNGVTHGFLDTPGVSGSPDTFTTIDVPGAVATYLSDINNRGQIIGTFTDTTGHTHAFFYSDGTFTPIKISNSGADGMNDLGQFLGSYSTKSSYYNNFIATPIAGTTPNSMMTKSASLHQHR